MEMASVPMEMVLERPKGRPRFQIDPSASSYAIMGRALLPSEQRARQELS